MRRECWGLSGRAGNCRWASGMCAWADRLVEEMAEVVEDGFEEVGVAVSEEGEGFVGAADEGAEDPAHLCADEAEDDDPDAKDSADVSAEDSAFDAVDG